MHDVRPEIYKNIHTCIYIIFAPPKITRYTVYKYRENSDNSTDKGGSLRSPIILLCKTAQHEAHALIWKNNNNNNNNNTFNDSRGQDGPIVNVTEMLSSGLKYIMTDIKSIDNIVP